MDNTERLAQALRDYFAWKDARCPCCDEGDEDASCSCTDHSAWMDQAEKELRAALASLAPAAVEGGAWNDAALFVNTCDSAYEQSTQFWRATSTEGHDLVAFQTTTGHLMQQCLRRTREMRKLTAPAPRGGVTEALEETQSTSRPFCPSCQESLLRIVDNAQPPSELQRELAGAQDTIKHALEHMDNGYPNAAHDALSYYLKRIRETPAAQAQDAGVKSNNAAIREHLRDDDRGSDAWWDRVHEKARALAAKEAK